MNTRAQKSLLFIAIGLSTVYSMSYYFLLDFWPPPPPTLSASEVVALYAHANMQFRIGVVLMILSGAFFIPWTVVIAIQMARDEVGVPVWAITQALSSAVATWFLMFCPVMWGMAAFNVGRAPELTVLLNEAAWLTFITPASFFPFQTFSVAAVALSSKKDEATSAFPRWLGWLSIWTGISGLVGAAAQMFQTGPFAWNGLFTFYLPVAVFGAWVGSITYTLFRALGRQEKAALVAGG